MSHARSRDTPTEKHTVGFYKRAVNRNQLYAVAVLPPVIFLLTGHIVLGVVFMLCVVGGRFSRAAGPDRPAASPRLTRRCA